MEKNKFKKGSRILEEIRRKELELKDLKKDIFEAEQLDEVGELIDNDCCYSIDTKREFRFGRQRILISKAFILERLKRSKNIIEKKIIDLNKEFDEL